MNGIIAPESIVNRLKQVVTEFLVKMQESNYDAVWHNMITLEAARFFSSALFPIHVYREGKIDEFLNSMSNQLSLSPINISSFIDVYAYNLQMEGSALRTELFNGLSAALKREGWYDVSLVFLIK